MSEAEIAGTIIDLDAYIRVFAATVAAAAFIYIVIRWLKSNL